MELLQSECLCSQNSSGLKSNKADNNSFEFINVRVHSTDPIKTKHEYTNKSSNKIKCVRIAQSVQGSYPGVGEIFGTLPGRP